MRRKEKGRDNPAPRGHKTVKVKAYFREDGVSVISHKRRRPK